MRLVLLFLLSAASFAQETYDVRLYSVQPPAKATVADAGGSSWKLCVSCPWQQLNGVLQLGSEGSQVRVSHSGLSPSVQFRGNIRITIEGSVPLALGHPVVISSKDDRLKLIAAIPAERYVEYVLAGESSAGDSPEFLKAMAVAARTYARHFPEQHKLEGFNLCDSTHCQNAQLGNPHAAFREAVEATHGELLWHRGSPAATYYHRHCGGKTEAAKDVWPDKAAPYLVAQDDPFCTQSKQQSAWQATISKADVVAALRSAGIQTPAQEQLRIVVARRSPAQRAQRISLSTSPADVIPASTLRFAVGRALGWNLIRSDWYDVSDRGADVLFTGRGHGHAVGLCQIGAKEMARAGKDYRAILAFYFPGTIAGINAQGFDWKVVKQGRIELRTTQVDLDSKLLRLTNGILSDLESKLPVRLPVPNIQLQVFGNTSQFRDATGEPGWIAASTRGRTIRLQPVSTLESRRILESTLRHELTHALVEANATAPLPLWFREGLVLHLTGESLPASSQISKELTEQVLAGRHTQSERIRAYANAKKLVEELISRHGITRVFEFLRVGLPADSR